MSGGITKTQNQFTYLGNRLDYDLELPFLEVLANRKRRWCVPVIGVSDADVPRGELLGASYVSWLRAWHGNTLDLALWSSDTIMLNIPRSTEYAWLRVGFYHSLVKAVRWEAR